MAPSAARVRERRTGYRRSGAARGPSSHAGPPPQLERPPPPGPRRYSNRRRQRGQMDKNVEGHAHFAGPTRGLVESSRLTREAGRRPRCCSAINQKRRQSRAPGADLFPEQRAPQRRQQVARLSPGPPADAHRAKTSAGPMQEDYYPRARGSSEALTSATTAAPVPVVAPISGPS